jgi:KDO2-lipid IV(A) lauroyltransferase
MSKQKKIATEDKTRTNLITHLTNKLLVEVLLLISYLPFRIIYFISDFLSFILSKVIKYRRKVILENLSYAFPEKSDSEIRSIMKKFYSHLSDLILETIKLHTISTKNLNKRITVHGLDEAENYYKQNKSLVVLGMHHNNWEWSGIIQKNAQHKVLVIYNPVRGNKTFEKFLIHSRERWGSSCVPVNKSARSIIEFQHKGIPAALWLLADQTSPANSKFWTIFLNREAPFFPGPEKIASKANLPILFQYIKKTGRGRYEFYFTTLIEKPAEAEPNEILLSYIRKMEEIIKKEPEYYLWSHRRWKHKRPDGIPLTL